MTLQLAAVEGCYQQVNIHQAAR